MRRCPGRAPMAALPSFWQSDALHLPSMALTLLDNRQIERRVLWEAGMILCCGEALIDMLPRETTLGEKGFAPYAGGAIFNTAIALGRLGVPTAFFTGIADDQRGEIRLAQAK